LGFRVQGLGVRFEGTGFGLGYLSRRTLVPTLPLRTQQGYLDYKKTLPPLGPSLGHRHRHGVGSYGRALSYERGTPVRERSSDQQLDCLQETRQKSAMVGHVISKFWRRCDS